MAEIGNSTSIASNIAIIWSNGEGWIRGNRLRAINRTDGNWVVQELWVTGAADREWWVDIPVVNEEDMAKDAAP